MDGHVKLSQFVKIRPQYKGVDVYSESVFNPQNSLDPSTWAYDPHWIEDDRPLTQQQAQLPGLPVNNPSAVTTALPDIVPLTSGNYLKPFLDTTEIPGHNLLRFTTAVGNMGDGPLVLTSSNTAVDPQGRQIVTQNIYSYDSSSNTFSLQSQREAGRFVYHPGHGHFHFEGYANYILHYNNNGTPGDVVLRNDGSEAVGDKVGFCLVNIATSFTIPGTSTSSSTLPGYRSSTSGGTSSGGQPATSCGFVQGIHVGHADVYDSQYDGQWIDVTGVANGSYFLEVTLDASNTVLEKNEANNTVFVPVTLNANPADGGNLQPDRFEPNNSFAQASDLGVSGPQTQSGLTIHISNENDYFKFIASSSGAYNVQLIIGDRDVNLYLYDSTQTLLKQSTTSQSGTSNNPAIETINWNFVAGQTYYLRAEGFGSDLSPTTSAVSSNYAVKISIAPTLQNAASIPTASEVGNLPGRFTLHRNGTTSSPLAVDFTLGGTATRGVDYNIYQDGVLVTGNTINIGNEAYDGNLDIVPISDGAVEPTENVTLTVSPSSGVYVIGGDPTASITIADTPPVVLNSAYQFETGPTGVSVAFSLDVSASLDPGDLTLTNLVDGTEFHPDTVSYNAATNTAYFGFNAPLANGNYSGSFKGSTITHAQGAELANDLTLSFFALGGDANRDRKVDIVDLGVMASNWQSTNRTFSQGDFNLDGKVDIVDLGILAANWQGQVPLASLLAGSPLPGAGASKPTAPPSKTLVTGPVAGTRTTSLSNARSVFAIGGVHAPLTSKRSVSDDVLLGGDESVL